MNNKKITSFTDLYVWQGGEYVLSLSASGSPQNQISCNTHQNKSNNNQIGISLSKHSDSLSPHIEEIHNNYENTAENNSQKIIIGKIHFDHLLIPLTKNNEKFRNMYESAAPEIKYANLSNDPALEKKGAITPPPNQAAAIVLKNSDNALSWPTDNFLITGNNSTASKKESSIGILIEIYEVRFKIYE